MKLGRHLCAALALCLVVLCVLPAHGQYQRQCQSLPLDSAILTGQLPCGLTYYIYRCLRPAYKANFYLMCNTGSTVEADHQRGMAHFIEHLAFDGTKHFPGNSLVESLEASGLSFGYDINAFTSHDATVYKITNVDTRMGKGLIDTCLLALKDIATSLNIEHTAVEKERAIIMEEWRSGNSAFSRMADKMFPILFGADNAYNRMPIGKPLTLISFTEESLRQFYETWYQPQHQAIAVIGFIEPEEIEDKLRQLWTDVPKPQNPSVRVWEQIPNHRGVTAGVVTDEELPGSQIDLWFKLDIPPRDQRDRISYINTSYIGYIAQSILSRRLGEMLFEEGTPYSGATAQISQYYLADSKDALRLYGLYDKTKRQQALQRLISEAKRAALYGVSDGELEVAVGAMRQLSTRIPTIFNEKNNYDHFDRISEHFLKGNIVLSVDDEVRTYADFTDTISVAAVNQFLREALSPDNLTAILAEKETGDRTVPSNERLRKTILAIWDTLQVSPYIFDESFRRPLIDHELKPGRVVEWEYDTLFDAKHYQLANGARVVVVRRDVLTDHIALRAVQRGGESVLLPQDFADGTFAPDLADLGGLGDFSVKSLSLRLANKNADLGTIYTPYAEMIEGESTVSDLETLLQLLHLRLTTVRADSTAFENWRKTRRANLRDLSNDPDAVFSDSIRSILYGRNHQYMRRINDADLDSLDFDNALRLFQQRISNPAAFDFIIVGNIDYDSIEPLIEKYIGSLPGNGNAPRQPHHRIDRWARPGHRQLRFAKPMPSPYTKVYMAYELHRPYTLIDESTLALLESLLQKIYIQSLRQDAGGTYTPNVGSASGEIDGFHSLFITFDTNADAAQSLVERAEAALKQIATNGPDYELFNTVKDYLLEQEHTATLQQSFPMTVFTHLALYNDLDPLDRYAALRSVTPAMVQSMASALISAPTRVTLILDGHQQ